jgi:hypothetical protein
MEFVRRNGSGEQEYYVKIRPEERGGEIRIRADVKEKSGGEMANESHMELSPPPPKLSKQKVLKIFDFFSRQCTVRAVR